MRFACLLACFFDTGRRGGDENGGFVGCEIWGKHHERVSPACTLHLPESTIVLSRRGIKCFAQLIKKKEG